MAADQQPPSNPASREPDQGSEPATIISGDRARQGQYIRGMLVVTVASTLLLVAAYTIMLIVSARVHPGVKDATDIRPALERYLGEPRPNRAAYSGARASGTPTTWNPASTWTTSPVMDWPSGESR